MIERKNIFPAMLIVIITISICYLSYAFLSDEESAYVTLETSSGSATLQVCVVDGWTDIPIEGATVVIPEINKSFKTDSQGKTPIISVPVIADTTYQSILEKSWGEITLLVYNDGYIPYALFHVMVSENVYRDGPTILLFQKGSTSSDDPFCIVEGPDTTWVYKLIEKYDPK